MGIVYIPLNAKLGRQPSESFLYNSAPRRCFCESILLFVHPMSQCSHPTELPLGMESVPRSLSGSPAVIAASSSSNQNGVGANEHPQREHHHELQTLSPHDLSDRPSPGQQSSGDRTPHRYSRQSRRLTRSAANGIAFAFTPRDSYIQIDPQSTAEETQVGDRSGQTSHTESRRHPSEHRSYRPRSCTSLLKEKGPRRRLITLVISAAFLVFVLALCKARFSCISLTSGC